MESNWIKYHDLKIAIPKIKNPTVLGFSSFFHDSSACIVKNGKILAAADEERFSRIKHDNGFPTQAISYCLNYANTKPDIVVYFENPDRKFMRIKETLCKTQHSDETYEKVFNLWENDKSHQGIQNKFTDVTGLANQVIFLDHHLSHAASAYFVSGYPGATIVTIDGVGEKTTTAIGVGHGRQIEMIKQIEFPHSIGLFYTALTVFLGFTPFEGEYKVMGLSSYGNCSRTSNLFYKKLIQSVQMFKDGSFMLNMKYFGHDSFEMRAYKPALVDHLGLLPRSSSDRMTNDYEDVAAALQLVTEDLIIGVLNYAYSITNDTRLCLAGGVALNSVINAKILSSTKFRELFIQPAAGDSGTSLGAAKYIQNYSDTSAPEEHFTNSYLGPEYDRQYIEDLLINQGIPYSLLSTRSELLETTAELLKNKNIIGWFQGRMEWGPRALGARSILASPLFDDIKDILNEKVKQREMFRPFAPVICIDDVDEFFDCDNPIPEPTDFMLMVYPIKEEKRKYLPGVTHVDGTGRLQTIRKAQNALYYDLIKKFGEKTGVPVLVNTSFNVNKEPIVCSPQDAINCLRSTEIDYLIIDQLIIKGSDIRGDNYCL